MIVLTPKDKPSMNREFSLGYPSNPLLPKKTTSLIELKPNAVQVSIQYNLVAGLNEESSLGSPLGNSMSSSLKAEAPNRFNWEDQGVKTSVKNQGQCGSCWSFAAIAQAEAKLIIDKKADSSIDLSEQYLLKCTYSSTCQGGYMRYAMQEALNVPTEEEYPYYPYRY